MDALDNSKDNPRSSRDNPKDNLRYNPDNSKDNSNNSKDNLENSKDGSNNSEDSSNNSKNPRDNPNNLKNNSKNPKNNPNTNPKGHIETFAAGSYHKSKYKDSHNAQGLSAFAGGAVDIEAFSKNLNLGLFAEYGNGKAKPSGDTQNQTNSYVGGGLLAKFDFYEDKFKERKVYTQVIARLGQATDSFKGKVKNGDTEYNNQNTMYAGGCLGVGYKQKIKFSSIDKTIALEGNLRYMIAHKHGKNAKLEDSNNKGRYIKFEDVNSQRIRLQAKAIYTSIDWIKPYIVLGCEYELGGVSKATIQDPDMNVGDIPKSSLKGASGTADIGANIQLTKGLDVDISAQGYIGQRQGVAGMLKIKYAFCSFGKQANIQETK
jgi:hypothetical protein